jgi:hypothetical protein
VEQGTPDYKLTDADKVIVGTDRPDWIAGMTNTFTYKDFELSCFIYARIGQEYFSSLRPGGSTGGQYVGYVRRVPLSDFWSPEHPNAKWPMLTSNPAAVSTTDVNQATYVNDGSFVAMRISLYRIMYLSSFLKNLISVDYSFTRKCLTRSCGVANV